MALSTEQEKSFNSKVSGLEARPITSASHKTLKSEDSEAPSSEWILWKSACTLKTRSGLLASGGLLKFEVDGQSFFVFVTTNRFLPTSSSEELTDSLLIFNVQYKTMHISLPRLSVRQIWTAGHLNATVVELTAEVASDCQAQGFQFLKIGVTCAEEKV